MSYNIEYDLIDEPVVLLSDEGKPIGELPKSQAHHEDTPLHLAFSLFLFDEKGQLLAQRRALSKKTWPGVWSNSCCGHPLPGESMETAVYRRTRYELGIELEEAICILPKFRYRASWNGLWENEVCPVWIGRCEGLPKAFSRDEVESVGWVSWRSFYEASRSPAGTEYEEFSPWSFLEAQQLGASEMFQKTFRKWNLRRSA